MQSGMAEGGRAGGADFWNAFDVKNIFRWHLMLGFVEVQHTRSIFIGSALGEILE
jgi:hypothetical protein